MATAIDSLLEKVGDESAREELRKLLEAKSYKAPKYDPQAVHENAEKAADKAIKSADGHTTPATFAAIVYVDARSKIGRWARNQANVMPIAKGGVGAPVNLKTREMQEAYGKAYCDYVNEACGENVCEFRVVLS